jgi:hypothetical protein
MEQTQASGQSYIQGSEAWAVGQRGGVDVGSSDETYHNNAKYWSGISGGYASEASGYKDTAVSKAGEAADSASTATSKALDAEAWAVGQRDGVDVESTDPTYTNNSKYYSQQSSSSASDAEAAASDAADIKDQISALLGVPTFTVDFSTGELIYTMENAYTFDVNLTTGNLEWEVAA